MPIVARLLMSGLASLLLDAMFLADAVENEKHVLGSVQPEIPRAHHLPLRDSVIC